MPWNEATHLEGLWDIYICIGSYQEVTAVVGCFQYPEKLFLQVKLNSQAWPKPFIMATGYLSVWPNTIPHDPTYPNSGRVKRSGKGHSFREAASCWSGVDSPSQWCRGPVEIPSSWGRAGRFWP